MFAVILVDNSQDFKADAQTFHRVTPKQNLGFAGGCNAGIEKAKTLGCHCVFLLNADVSIDEKDALSLHETLTSQSLAAVSPILIEQRDGKDEYHFGGRNPLKHHNTRIVSEQTSQSTDPDYLPGTAVMISMSALDEIGLLDENYFFSGEIADWFLRLKQTSFRFKILDDVFIKHHSSGNEKYRSRHYIYYSLRNRYLLMHKFGGDQVGKLTSQYTKSLRRQMLGALLRLDIQKCLVIFNAVKDGKAGRFGQSQYFK